MLLTTHTHTHKEKKVYHFYGIELVNIYKERSRQGVSKSDSRANISVHFCTLHDLKVYLSLCDKKKSIY